MGVFVNQSQDRPGRALRDGPANAARTTQRREGEPAATPGQPTFKQTLNSSDRVQSQLQLQQTLNQSPRVAAQMKLADVLNSRSDALPVNHPLQREGETEEEQEVLQGEFEPVQRQASAGEDEKPIQGKSETVLEKEADVIGNEALGATVQTRANTISPYTYNTIIQRLVDPDLPNGTKVYVSNPDSQYYEWRGTIVRKGEDENTFEVRIGDPNNWRAASVTETFSINDLVQLPQQRDFNDQSLAEATGSQLDAIKEMGIVGHNRGIAEGSFTGRKDERGNIDIRASPEAIRQLREQVLDFTAHARALAERVREGQGKVGKFLRVYRGMHSPDVYALEPGATIVEPIPFSTTFNKQFAKKWTETDQPHEAVIMKIEVPISFPMIYLSSPKWLGNFRVLGNEVVNQGQQEVTLAPMQLRITDMHMEGEYKVFDMLAEHPLSDEDIAEIFGEASALSAERRRQIELDAEYEDEIDDNIEDEIDEYDPEELTVAEAEAEARYQSYASELGEHRS